MNVLNPPELSLSPRRLAAVRGVLDSQAAGRRHPRRLLLVAAIVALLAIAGTAVAVGTDLLTQQKLFHERYPGGPLDARLVGDYEYVAEGSDWALIAWKSTRGICLDYAVPDNYGSACGLPVKGSPPDTVFTNPPTHSVGFFSGTADATTMFVAGPVAHDVAAVRVELRDGRTLDAKTYDAPPGLGTSLRFYLLRTDAVARETRTDTVKSTGKVFTRPINPVAAVVGYGRDGNVIERFAVPS